MIKLIKKTIWIILIILILSFSVNIGYTQVYATTVDDVMGGAKNFVSGTTDHIDSDTLEDMSDFIYNILLGIAIVAAVIVGMVLGIQFMIAGADEKAKIKESLIPYVVSCVVIFGAFGIWNLLVTLFNQI